MPNRRQTSVVSRALATDGWPAEGQGQPHSFRPGLPSGDGKEIQVQSSPGLHPSQFPHTGYVCSKQQGVQGSCSETRAGHHFHLTSDHHDSHLTSKALKTLASTSDRLVFLCLLFHHLLHSLTSLRVCSSRKAHVLRAKA